MKKFTSLSAILVLLAIPMAANAIPFVGTGELNVHWSYPTSGGSPNYYTDYDGRVVSTDFGYNTEWEEIFCVSQDPANFVETVDFYKIIPELDTSFNTGFYTKLAQAAWIADNWISYGTSGVTTDFLKGEAQKAVWQVTGVMSRVGTEGIDYEIYLDALGHTNYHTDNWLFAHSSGVGTTPDYQDYLTPKHSVPEPGTVMLLGISLICMAGIGRKKIIRH